MSTILFTNPTNLDLAKKCLALIRDVAARGACSEDPGLIGYALQELTQVLLERTGIEDRLFEPSRPTILMAWKSCMRSWISSIQARRAWQAAVRLIELGIRERKAAGIASPAAEGSDVTALRL
jgi:hypothetical protein